MPRVHLTEMEKEQERLKANLKLMQGGRTNAEMGKICGTSATTYARRLANPKELTYFEAYCICKHFRVPVADFYARELKID